MAITTAGGAQRPAARCSPSPFALVGIIGVIAGEGALRIIAWGVIGVAITVTTALVFLEVGYSEDRARTRDSASGSSKTPRPPSATAPRRGPLDRSRRRPP